MVGGWPCIKSLLEIDFLGLRHPCSGGLSPSVVVFKEHIIKVLILVPSDLDLVEERWNVREIF